ncbi:MAG TPA: Uma2 family endonuclease [Gemmataceae bacterium]|nr:Uma2 family endonuclease [Gemmataceae bacterium]
MVVATPPAMTIDEFFKLHGGETNVELVRGQVVRYPKAGARHGLINVNATMLISGFVRGAKLGRVMSNDTLIRIAPDTARGADVCFLSYAKLPADIPVTEGVLELPPELVVEVKSPSDLWTDLLGKVLDYLRAGVGVIVAIDPKTESVSVFRPGERQDIFEKDETLTIPDVLPGFEVAVARFFEE